MKKYNTPEIEALALETIDVIAASNEIDNRQTAADKLGAKEGYTSQGTIALDNANWNW